MAEPKTPRNWRARIAALPPIDWAALAQEQDRSRWRRTPKQIKATVEHWRLGRVKAMKRRRKEKAKAIRERRKRPTPVLNGHHRVALVLGAAGWLTRVEVCHAVGAHKNCVKMWLRRMCAAGLTERRETKTRPNRYWPRFEYRLTELGGALRREAEFLS